MPNRTTVCRCEDLTLEDIRCFIAKGYKTIDEIKRMSRCGMGACQGRGCRPTVSQEIAQATGQSIDQVKQPKFRPPTKPIELGILLGSDEKNAQDS